MSYDPFLRDRMSYYDPFAAYLAPKPVAHYLVVNWNHNFVKGKDQKPERFPSRVSAETRIRELSQAGQPGAYKIVREVTDITATTTTTTTLSQKEFSQ